MKDVRDDVAHRSQLRCGVCRFGLHEGLYYLKWIWLYPCRCQFKLSFFLAAFIPDSDRFILAPCCQMSILVRVPAQPKTFSTVSKKFYLGVYLACRDAWMFSPIPDHNSPICAHCSDYIRVLWLIPSLVHFSFVIDLLHNVESDLHDRALLSPATSVAANLLTLFIVVCRISYQWFWKLYVCNLKIVLSLARCVSANQETMSGIVLIRYAALISYEKDGGWETYDCLSGSHWVERVGHSRAVLSIKSYKNGAFFFHVLYSSFTSFSSILSSSCSSAIFTMKVELVIRINQYELLEQFPTRITVIHCTPYLPMTCFSIWQRGLYIMLFELLNLENSTRLYQRLWAVICTPCSLSCPSEINAHFALGDCLSLE